MRQCLSAVGEVAEFASVRKQLEVLEERPDSMVQPRLTDALQIGGSMLLKICGEFLFTKVHLKPIRKLWEDFELKQRASKPGNDRNEMERLSGHSETQSTTRLVPFLSWLPSFNDELLLYLEQEWKCYFLCPAVPSIA